MTKTEITPHSIYWIRQDLRVSDNPALAKAAEAGYLAIYIFCLLYTSDAADE